MLGSIFIRFWPRNPIRHFLYTHFKVIAFDVRKYQNALTHPSITSKNSTYEGFERLEFLGDGVIDLVVSYVLMLQFPNENEGALTKIKSFVVSRKTLGKIALEIGLPSVLLADTRSFSERTSIYGNALEAVIGAIYLDKGYGNSAIAVEYILRKHLDFNTLLDQVYNLKGEVIEWAQKQKKAWHIETQELPHKKHLASLFIDNQIQTVAVASSKKEAEQKACRIFWDLGMGV